MHKSNTAASESIPNAGASERERNQTHRHTIVNKTNEI